MSAPSASELYNSCMETAGDLIMAIQTTSKLNYPLNVRSESNRYNAQAALALIQAAVTIHAASKTAINAKPKDKR